jgi:hypothetical protein
MSEHESHTGKIRLLQPLDGETFDQQCRRLWVQNGKKEKNYHEDSLFDEFYNKYFRMSRKDNRIWEVFDHKEEDPYASFIEIEPNPDGSYSFRTRFWNGGTGMTEMVANEMKKLSTRFSQKIDK